MHTETSKEHIDANQFIQNENQEKKQINAIFSRKEFDYVIKKLKNGKAEGSDAISNEMIKNSPKIILDLLYRFFNVCIHQSLIPEYWCLELLNPIHKEGSKSDPNNYR